MKLAIIFPFILTACGSELATSSDENPHDPHSNAYESTDAGPLESSDETSTSSEPVTSDSTNSYRNDITIRMLACTFIPILIDTNPITGEGTYLIRWKCPPGWN